MLKPFVPGRLDVLVENTKRCAVLAVRGELDSATAPRLNERLMAAIAEAPPGAGVVLDLSDVTFCGSAGVQAVLLAGDQARELDRGFAVACGPFVRRTLELVGLRHLVGDHPTRAAALASVG
ncbi:STAS domain-containing protein [Actinokineospora guangxiensis]|uniref:STAS domain-containing protein n=1 Tax=Actinokineospora guangxiensis TaxID=1490288 RepID=A0ABW0EXU9_9PSEU